MTAAHDPAECQRLLVEQPFNPLADQLEAACAEVERLTRALPNFTHQEHIEQRDALIRMSVDYEERIRALTSERDSLRADVVKAKDEHTSDGLAWFELELALTMERDSLRRQLETERKVHAATILDLRQQLETVWKAAGQGDVTGWLTLADIVDGLRIGRDSLRQQLEAAQRTIDDCNDGYRRLRDREQSGLAAAQQQLEAAQMATGLARMESAPWARDLAAAQQRIAGLEGELAALKAGAALARQDDERVVLHVTQLENDELSAQLLAVSMESRALTAERERDALKARVAELEATLDGAYDDSATLRAILHTIWPVYRAAVAVRDKRREISKGMRFPSELPPLLYDMSCAIDTARSLLTPDLIAAAERAGLEVG